MQWVSSNLFKSFGRAMASTSPGWPVQLRVHAVAHQGTAARRVASPNCGPTRWRPICVKPSYLSRRTGRSVGRWPRLPLAVGAAAGRSRPPGSVQLRPSSSRGSPRWRSLRAAGPPRTKRGHLGSSGGRSSCGSQCATRERQAVSPAAGPRGGGLSSLAGGGTDSARPRSSGVTASGDGGSCPAGS
jgi:hypothetical protein